MTQDDRKTTTVVLPRSNLSPPPPAPADMPAVAEVDYVKEGYEIDVPLLRALALGRKRSSEMQLLLDGEVERSAHKSAVVRNAQMLALLLADLSVPDSKAEATFKRLLAHRDRLSRALHRPVGLKATAMDYLENVERALRIIDDDNGLTYSQLVQMAYTDQLTGLANFRFFSQRLRDEVKRGERYGHLLSLLMADIDYFKSFNDKHGHPAGNRALQYVARTLFAEVRDTDQLARYGGEEFALILPHTTKIEACNLAERIRARIASVPFKIDDGAFVPLSISLGVATFSRDVRSEEGLVSAADQALYQAKHTGRNRVCIFAPLTKARFRYVPDPSAVPASVSVIGAFNDWKIEADVMKRTDSGSFELDIPLGPGKYHYKYVFNGREYLPDPGNSKLEADGFGGINSVIVVEG